MYCLHTSTEEPWSKCNATGTVMFIASNNAFTIAETTVGPPMYLPAPSDTPKIIGELAS